jgi:hypothetical protein
VNSGERFNELQVFRMRDEKRDRGLTSIYCGSQVPQYAAFFGFDFAGGGLGFLTSRYSKSTTWCRRLAGEKSVFRILNLAPGTKKFWRPSTSQAAPGRGYPKL